ncbi:unnamed protein product [Pleuronectes platessa]|uniref:Uncharacterized protein n=1 Tax=Pleuronectes platessa TaxID=8262 RepID=A0A9N7ULB7_PLEPL|nr:unnamed protein product [Pleuronectes platessa]
MGEVRIFAVWNQPAELWCLTSVSPHTAQGKLRGVPVQRIFVFAVWWPPLLCSPSSPAHLSSSFNEGDIGTSPSSAFWEMQSSRQPSCGEDTCCGILDKL